jgi:hypothetical protein
MKTDLFLKNSMKTLSTRPAQIGLRYTAANLKRTHMFHASVGMLDEMVEVFDLLQGYLSGSSQWNPSRIPQITDELGDVGYYMVVLARQLKVRLPASTRNLKLRKLGVTQTEAMYQMLQLSGTIVSQYKKKVFYGPVMVPTGKATSNGEPKVTVDRKATAMADAVRDAKARQALTQFVPLYWGVVHAMLNVPPSDVFDKIIAKLALRYPDGTFDLGDVNNKDTEAEAAVFS